MLDWLDPDSRPEFPPTAQALEHPNGLLAAGGRVSPLWLDAAYRRGIFPWNDPQEVRLWWSPAPRAIITAEQFRLSRTIRKLLRRQPYFITANQAFEQVQAACAEPRDAEGGTWIDDELLLHYPRLHAAGRAISVEAWNDGALVGGWYGVLIGSALFGESMFSRASNASKLAFATAAPILLDAGVTLIDCQMQTEHLAQFGCMEVERAEFEDRLRSAIQHPTPTPLPCVLS
ncbi:leucyl/phenylalanyl-tRNA--protein transferase [Bacterioplanes sanyensis]|uniref:Leucyl/phenylalanyl-tRNA--protein transferase n=1 Tax=Bacterioplanes sanyensis TaxID=1249553 RepID=A0A222FNH6_9GAMM|nr:leucyl/phenylalanyl-tRNA--protein transferase [Bacterioplanes sanyensis]ASP39773.1 leucyl/phenylalanyl-tRNA--protein transferase [Bacterioplanes sanyensis]